jgi:hypothetical protein
VTAPSEAVKDPKFTLRYATPDDIDAIVDVDIRSFDSVYSNYDQDEQELRDELRQKFQGRLDKVGSKWMPVLERDGEIVGFMTCCPTSKKPGDFTSWEAMTDNGTLEDTYDPNGEYVYVVTLSVLPEGSEAKDMLFANQIGKLLRDGYKTAYFESRLPGLRDWVVDAKFEGTEQGVDELSPERKRDFANEYFALTTQYKGKEVRYDRLISLYERVGCKCLQLVEDAYKDKPSLDFGVVCAYDGSKLFDGSDIPVKLPENRLTRWAFGVLMQKVSKSQKLTEKVMG